MVGVQEQTATNLILTPNPLSDRTVAYMLPEINNDDRKGVVESSFGRRFWSWVQSCWDTILPQCSWPFSEFGHVMNTIINFGRLPIIFDERVSLNCISFGFAGIDGPEAEVGI